MQERIRKIQETNARRNPRIFSPPAHLKMPKKQQQQQQ